MNTNTSNKNAEKWTADAVRTCLEKIEVDVLLEPLPYLNATFTNLRMPRHLWPYWKRKFAAHEDITDHMDIIEGICERKLMRAAISGDIPITMAIFALKNNHHWSDRVQAAELPVSDRLPMIIEIDENTTLSIP